MHKLGVEKACQYKAEAGVRKWLRLASKSIVRRGAWRNTRYRQKVFKVLKSQTSEAEIEKKPYENQLTFLEELKKKKDEIRQ